MKNSPISLLISFHEVKGGLFFIVSTSSSIPSSKLLFFHSSWNDKNFLIWISAHHCALLSFPFLIFPSAILIRSHLSLMPLLWKYMVMCQYYALTSSGFPLKSSGSFAFLVVCPMLRSFFVKKILNCCCKSISLILGEIVPSSEGVSAPENSNDSSQKGK